MVMRIGFLIAGFILILSAFVLAQQPNVQVYTDRGIYSAGECGTIFIDIDTFGKLSSAEIEALILSPEGQLVDGYIIITDIPEETVLNPQTEQTIQTIIEEDIEYFQEEMKVTRQVNFKLSENLPLGSYPIEVLVRSPEMSLQGSGSLMVVGPGVFDITILIYIAIVIFSIYLMRGG